jgi:DNA primase
MREMAQEPQQSQYPQSQPKSGDTVQKIKDKISIVEVVVPYVKLAKAGKYMRGLSPFTKEKTPSFFVNVERGSYFCFSTGQGGDMFTFVQKMEGVDFMGSLKILAEKAGVEITHNPNAAKDRGRAERLRDAMAQATQFFSVALTNTPACEYALSRGLTEETIKAWSLGFAPDTWRALLEDLQAKGFTNVELVAAGLIKEADGRTGTWYDRFRNRLMFPIRDIAGRTVAFTGRALAADDQAKYLNSPETELFHKSEVLFGMDRAKDAIRTRNFAILVEGQFDLLLLHQIGFQNTIALSGTALSPQHLVMIKRYAENLMLCLDADKAGLAASAKNAEAALRAGMRVKAVRIPAGKDPADLASAEGGARDFAKRVGDAQSIVEFFLSVLTASEKDPLRLVMAAEKTVLPLIAAIQSPLEQEHFIGVTARSLGLTSEAVRASLARLGGIAPTQGTRAQGTHAHAPTNRDRFSSDQRNKPDSTNVLSSVASTAMRRGEFILALAENYADKPLAESLKSEYSRIIGAVPSEPDIGGQQPISERALFEAGLAYGEPPTDSEIVDLIRVFERAVLTEKLKDATNELRRAEMQKDAAAIHKFAEVCKEINTRLSTLN